MTDNIDTLIERLVVAVAEFTLGRGEHAAVLKAREALRAEVERLQKVEAEFKGYVPFLAAHGFFKVEVVEH